MADYREQGDYLARWEHDQLAEMERSLGIKDTSWDLRPLDDRLPELDPPTGTLTTPAPSRVDRFLRCVGGVVLWSLAAVAFLAILASMALVVIAVVLLAIIVLAGYASWPLAIVVLAVPGAALVAHALTMGRGEP